MTLPEQLRNLAAAPSLVWQPLMFDLSNAVQSDALAQLVETGAVRCVRDSLDEQWTDWLKATHPQSRPKSGSGTSEFRNWPETALRQSQTMTGQFRNSEVPDPWVFYPWSGVLAHVLPKSQYRFLRTTRNRYKITAAEQELLFQKTVAVAGLSVGLSVVMTLALEGVSRFRLADFDSLGLSNLNRLRAGLPDLGTNKAVLAARQLYELDPYLEIELFPSGVSAHNIGEFLAAPLDVLIEECDDLGMKIRLREEARYRRIPVVMDTSDRGLLDVERFDREPDRPLLHGMLGSLRADELAGLTPAEKVPFGLRILDPARLSVALRASLPEVGQTIETWPQLASAVALGGGVTADAVRRILLGQFTESGRYYVDVSELVRDGAGIEIPQPEPTHRPVFRVPETPPRPVPGTAGLSSEEIQFVVAHAILAPSGGNSQPWSFVWRAGRLLGYVVPERTAPFLDHNCFAAYLALGAAAENLALAAASIGLSAHITPCPDVAEPLLAFRAEFSRGATVVDADLFAQIPLRVTNRRIGSHEPLTDEEHGRLASAAATQGGEVQFLESPEELERIAALMGRCDRYFLLTPNGHRDTFGEIRFTPEQVARTRDGLDVTALEVTAGERAALAVLADWKVMARVREVGGGQILEQPARRAIAGSVAVAMIRSHGHGAAAYFRSGRAFQRLWLTATQQKLALHPWTGLPYLLARIESGETAGLTPEEQGWFASLCSSYRELIPRHPNSEEVMLFRISRADTPTARSLRRPLDDVFQVVE